jgi:hypothetical protein
MQDFIPGFLQGLTRVLISYPFDYVRTKFQANPQLSWKDIQFGKNVYRGVSIPLITVPIDRALQFGIYERMNRGGYTLLQSSLVATLLSSLYSVPANYLQTQVMIHKDTKLRFSNMSFRGYGADTARSVLSSFIYLNTYGYLRKTIPEKHHNYFLFGIVSSSILWSIVYPLDTLRVLKQTTDKSYSQLLKTHTNFLYKGLPLVLLRSIPSSGMGMFVYETSRAYINKRDTSCTV